MRKYYLQPSHLHAIALRTLFWCVFVTEAAGAYGQVPQKASKPLMDLHGQVSLRTDLFASSNPRQSDSLIQRPDFNQRLNANFGFSVLGIQMASKVNLSLPLGGFGATRLPSPNLREYLQRRSNGVELNLRRNNYQLRLGTFVAKVSKLTAGNIPYTTGIMASGTPLGFKASASIGITQAEIAHDTSLGRPGAFRRMMATAQVGYGDEKKSYLYLNFVRVRDDTVLHYTSDALKPMVNPLDASVVSLSTKTQLTKRIHLEAEYALSAFSDDRTAKPFPIEFVPNPLRDGIEAAGQLILFNSSTRFGLAYDTKLTYKTKKSSISVRTEQRGAGYRSPAQYAQQNDFRNNSVLINHAMYRNRLVIEGEGGLRDNNLSNVSNITTRQAIFRGSVNTTICKVLRIGANGTNYGISMVSIDTTAVQQQISKNLGVNAVLGLGKSVRNTFMVNASIMDYEDNLDSASPILGNSSQMINVFHQVSFPNRLAINIAYNGFKNDGQSGANQRQGLVVGFQHQLMEDRLKVSGQFRYSTGQGDPSGTGRVLALVGSACLQLTKQLNATLRCDLRQQEVNGETVGLQFINTAFQFKF